MRRPGSVGDLSHRSPCFVPLVLAAVMGVAMLGCSGSGARSNARDERVSESVPLRLGTYDSRAVAIAYGRSGYNRKRIDGLMVRHQRAVEAGDERLAAELAREGEAHQVRMHLQAFSNARVDDALDPVRDRLASIAEDAGVGAIVAAADYRAASVEVVDVTDAIVRLYNPDAQTLRIIADCRGKAPKPIEEIALLAADE